MLNKIFKTIALYIQALYKPTEIELEELGRSIDRLNHAIAVEKGDKEYKLGQLAYALRHAIEAHHGTGAKLPYRTRIKLLRFLATAEWKNANELGNNISRHNGVVSIDQAPIQFLTALKGFDNRVDSSNETLFQEVIKKPLVVLSEIFLYSPQFKNSNLSQILSLVKGQNASA